jgi:hypothetical protein
MNATPPVLFMLKKEKLEMPRDKLSPRLNNYSKLNLDCSRNTLTKDLRTLKKPIDESLKLKIAS